MSALGLNSWLAGEMAQKFFNSALQLSLFSPAIPGLPTRHKVHHSKQLSGIKA